MCDDCVTCDYVNVDIDHLNYLSKKYNPKNFNELMEAERKERRNKLIKLCDSILRDKN